MSTIKFTMPTKGNKLVEREDCVIARRAKEKAEWEKKKQQRAGDTSGTAQQTVS